MNLRHVLAVATIVFTIGFSIVSAAPASAASSGDFVNSINSLRAGKGLNTLVVDSRLQAEAQGWAEKMAAAGSISHNPALGSTPGNWSKVGENVGVGGDVSSLMQAFINSPHHYENLVDASFNSVGVGVAVGSDGRIYTTHDFANYPGVGGASAPSTTAKKTTTSSSAGSTTSSATAKVSGTTTKKATPTTVKAPAATTTTTTAAPPVEAPPAPPAPVAPPLPDPSARIVQGLVEVGSISAQG